jgi:hypothetical protein
MSNKKEEEEEEKTTFRPLFPLFSDTPASSSFHCGSSSSFSTGDARRLINYYQWLCLEI